MIPHSWMRVKPLANRPCKIITWSRVILQTTGPISIRKTAIEPAISTKPSLVQAQQQSQAWTDRLSINSKRPQLMEPDPDLIHVQTLRGVIIRRIKTFLTRHWTRTPCSISLTMSKHSRCLSTTWARGIRKRRVEAYSRQKGKRPRATEIITTITEP